MNALRSAFLGFVLAALPVAAAAEDCVVSGALLDVALDSAHQDGAGISADEFAKRSDGEKWYWTASLLTAQAARMQAVLKDVKAKPREWVLREANIYLIFDASEPCYRDAAGPWERWVQVPDQETREQLKARMEDLL